MIFTNMSRPKKAPQMEGQGEEPPNGEILMEMLLNESEPGWSSDCY
jgi:hypothetical protein